MKKLISISLFAATCLLSCGPKGPVGTADYDVIPLPQTISIQEESAPFRLNKKTKIVCGTPGARRAAELLQKMILKSTGWDLAIKDKDTKKAGKGEILILADEDADYPLNSTEGDAYTIVTGKKGITIDGKSWKGAMNGVRTLAKSIIPGQYGTYEFPAAEISDCPLYAHRGAHLDVSRHFFPADSVLKFLDMMSLHNLNRFHWHLTDDQGWRLPIKSRPELIEKGSVRKQTVIGRNTGEYDGTPYGGNYSAEDIRKVTEYAKSLGIEVIPEVDLPGHMQAALCAYPDLGCKGGPYDIWEIWGVSDDVLCAGNDATYKLIDDVLTEVAALFPDSHYIHVGGDECPKTRWESCKKCQAKIKSLGLKDDDHSTAEMKLQSHVIHFADSVVRSHGKVSIGWNEILEGGIDKTATIHAWTGFDKVIEAVNLGHDVVVSPTSHFYFDYYQVKDTENEPLAIGGYVPLSKLYSFDPMPEDLAPELRHHILGPQANLWTEYVATFPHVQYMELPRMAALSEVAWGKNDNDNFDMFKGRLERLKAHYRNQDFNYCTKEE